MENIEKDKLFSYTFYNEQSQLVVVLNEEYIKKIYNADVVLLNETEHK